jgi:hypothetical protein
MSSEKTLAERMMAERMASAKLAYRRVEEGQEEGIHEGTLLG